MVSARDMEALQRLRPQDRLLLEGDPRQLASVEAGNPFALLLDSSMLAHVHIDEIQRQRDPQLRQIAEAFAAGRARRRWPRRNLICGKCSFRRAARIVRGGRRPRRRIGSKQAIESGAADPVLIFDDPTGRSIDVDTRGSDQEMLVRLAQPTITNDRAEAAQSGCLLQSAPDSVDAAAQVSEPRGRGRPTLGPVLGRLRARFLQTISHACANWLPRGPKMCAITQPRSLLEISTMLARQQADRGTTNMAAMNLNAGALALVVNEVDCGDLPVTGTIPRDINGVLVRNGPNPLRGRFEGNDKPSIGLAGVMAMQPGMAKITVQALGGAIAPRISGQGVTVILQGGDISYNPIQGWTSYGFGYRESEPWDKAPSSYSNNERRNNASSR